MYNKIPVPTDNIYKFYAVFSLLVLIFSMAGVIYISNYTNQIIFESQVDFETLNNEKGLTYPQQVRKSVLSQKIAVAASNRKFFAYALGGFFALATVGMIYGFKKWHTEIQPIIDATAKIQLEIGRVQLAKMQLELDALTEGIKK